MYEVGDMRYEVWP